jgi:hypothetical protein
MPRTFSRPDVAADNAFRPEDITEDHVLTDWEVDFLASVGAQDYDLTPAQQEKLDEIESEIPMRLELARQGRWPIRR